ncbi:DUF3237 domain-containing protein [Geobacillus thermodenitrificans]|uniref:DUF3237 domain-containing protein n=1 Tax=Geobacillus thermodenitrificans TaxID=33940 RepID=UPI0022B7D7D7|nr:DUF3237 domain-containing protein [Geobacillus thermodenitrificans]MED3717865.1 DUF3237 domain-containing protein [Geobacillus thermodenitrificans]MED4916960.1 DUF3237 domain-containing protein [Geobacillus thermodenitrificans]
MKLEHVFTAHIEVGKPIEIGDVGIGYRRVIPIIGGSFEGARMRGKVLPGGADYQLIRKDGVAEILAHYIMETDDRVPIYIVNKGYRHGPKEVIEKIFRGEDVPQDSYYFKTTPVFEVSNGHYDFLNKMIFIGEGIRKPTKVEIAFYQIL